MYINPVIYFQWGKTKWTYGMHSSLADFRLDHYLYSELSASNSSHALLYVLQQQGVS